MDLRSILVFLVCITKIECQLYYKKAYPWPSRGLAMVWVDGRYRYHPPTIDTFYDRLVGIAINMPDKNRGVTTPLLATGVLITPRLILTSFNAFRRITQHQELFQLTHMQVLIGRLFVPNLPWGDPTLESKLLYVIPSPTYFIQCARQVVPDFADDYPSHMIHGPNRPHHDLAVVRVDRSVPFVDRKPLYSFAGYHNYPISRQFRKHQWDMMPIRTILAKPGDELGDSIRFASVGHVNDEHIREHRFTYMREFSLDDKVVADCEEWFPREWGNFICILNIDKFVGLASGAMLFSGDLLFGVGCFALFKGTSGVLVFTDIRPYWHLLYRTCTDSDQNLEIPEPSSVETDEYYNDYSNGTDTD